MIRRKRLIKKLSFRRLIVKRPCPNCGKMYPVSQNLHRCSECGTIYCGAHDCRGEIGEGSCPNPNCNSNSASPAVFDDAMNTWV